MSSAIRELVEVIERQAKRIAELEKQLAERKQVKTGPTIPVGPVPVQPLPWVQPTLEPGYPRYPQIWCGQKPPVN